LQSPAARLLERNRRLLRTLSLPRRAHQSRAQTCIAFGGMRVDAAVSAEVLRLLDPLGVEAAPVAIATRDAEFADTRRPGDLALGQARYETDLARRQYDAVDPANRLVAGELERRWNDRLAEVQRQEERLAAIFADMPSISAAERERLALAVLRDVPLAPMTAATRAQPDPAGGGVSSRGSTRLAIDGGLWSCAGAMLANVVAAGVSMCRGDPQ
jgi:hypothetical protein